MKLSFSFESWKAFCDSETFSVQGILKFLDRDFGVFFRTDADVWEGYTLGEHTGMVLGQFERYVSAGPLPTGIDRDLFRLILALHDIGKPEAIQNGGKHLQHRYTLKRMKRIFSVLGIEKEWQLIALSLISGDPLGKYLRDRISLIQTREKIGMMADQAEQPFHEFFDLLLVFFMVDAGSYTLDAGGLRSLDHLFEFNHHPPRMNFAPPFLRKIQKVRDPDRCT